MVIGQFTKVRSRRAFLHDRAGNVAMMWGLMGTVLLGLVGLTVDFTRAQSIRNAMQNAADGAGFVAERC
jgi:Flp pilus assembly protein TadG